MVSATPARSIGLRRLVFVFLLVPAAIIVNASDTATGLPLFRFCNLTFPQSAVPDVNTVYIPFKQVGQLMMVEATVDTVTGLFIVDTGSERLVLNKKHYPVKADGRTIAAAGNTGLVGAVYGKNIDSIKMEKLVVPNLFAHVIDLSHIETKKNIRLAGILGYNVFREFALFIDFPQKRIVLFRTRPSGVLVEPQAQWEVPSDSLAFTLKKHFILVDATVNAVKVKLIIDSGAELNLIDRHVNRKVLDKFTIIKRVNLVGVGKKEVEVLAGVLKEVHVGRQYAEKMNTLFTSLDDMNQSFDVQADGVLGYEFLKNRRTLINYAKRKVYFFNPVRS